MTLQKLEGVDAFIVLDLEGAERSVGVTRLAPKILVDGATLLARSNTYAFASFELAVGGASAGINAKPEDREGALAGFTAAAEPLVASGSFSPLAGKGVTDADLTSLRAADPVVFDPLGSSALLAAGVLAAAAAVRPLDGARVLVDGIDVGNVSLLDALASSGATIVGFATAKGAVISPAGVDATAATQAVAEHGAEAVYQLGDVHPLAGLFRTEADLVFAGSKSGVIDDGVAETMSVAGVIPIAAVPVTAKALATLRRAGTVVLPDFLSAAGPVLARVAAAPSSPDAVGSAVTAALAEVVDHPDGPLLGACYRAETFLRTWQDTLPFGRPLA